MIRSAVRFALSASASMTLGACILGGEKATAPEVTILGVRSEKPNSLMVTWTAAAADYYTAYWSEDSAAALSGWAKLENVAQTKKVFDANFKTIGYGHEFVHLVNGKRYYFRITANKDGATRPSPIASGIPVIQGPDSFQLLSGNHRMLLSWKDPRPGIRHFAYRSRNDSSAVKLEAGPDGLIDSGVVNGIGYRYWVTAVDSVCESNPSDTLGSRPTPLSEWDPIQNPAPPAGNAYSHFQDGKGLYEVAYFPQDDFVTRNAQFAIRFTPDLENWGNVAIADSLTKDSRIIALPGAFFLLRSRATSAWNEPHRVYALDIYRSADLSAWELSASLPGLDLPPIQQAVGFDSALLLLSGRMECRTRDARSLDCDTASRYFTDQDVNNHEFVRVGDSLIEFGLSTYNSMRFASANLKDWKTEYMRWPSPYPVFPRGFTGQYLGNPPRPRKIVWRDGVFYALGDLNRGVLLYSADGTVWDAVSVAPLQSNPVELTDVLPTENGIRIYFPATGSTSGWFKARR